MTVSKLIPQRIRNLQVFPNIEERLTEDESFFQKVLVLNQRAKSEVELSNKINELLLNEFSEAVSNVVDKRDGGVGVYIFSIEDDAIDSIVTFTTGLVQTVPFEVVLKTKGVSIEKARTMVNFTVFAALETDSIDSFIKYLREQGNATGLRFLETTFSDALGDNLASVNEVHVVSGETPVVLITDIPEENLRLV